jgi:transcriptional regulator with XRE-family HTH domain
MTNITTGQVRAARALLRWTAEELAQAAGVSVATIRRAEPTDGPLTMMPANAAAIVRALEAAGIIFVPENGEGPGVRMRKVGSAAG